MVSYKVPRDNYKIQATLVVIKKIYLKTSMRIKQPIENTDLEEDALILITDMFSNV